MLRYIVVFLKSKRVILPRANARLLGFEAQDVRMRFFSWENARFMIMGTIGYTLLDWYRYRKTGTIGYTLLDWYRYRKNGSLMTV
jgi:hypothetical protein